MSSRENTVTKDYSGGGEALYEWEGLAWREFRTSSKGGKAT